MNTIIDPDGKGPVTYEQKSRLLDRLTEIYASIADEKGMNVPYTASINGSIFPQVVSLTLGDEDEEDSCLDEIRFLAENDYILPKKLQNAPDDEIRKYIQENEREILSSIESDAESDLEYT